MGADGGICWVYINKPFDENHQKLQKLLPWPLRTWDDYYDEYHYKFLDSNSIPDGTMSSTYGTNQEFSLMDIRDIYNEKDELFEEYGKDITLKDVLMLLKVLEAERDMQQIKRFRFTYLIYDCYNSRFYGNFQHYYTKDRKEDEEFLSLTLEEWYNKTFECIKIHKTHYGRTEPSIIWEETWT